MVQRHDRHDIERHPPFSTYVAEQRMLVTTTTDGRETVTRVDRGTAIDLQLGREPYFVVQRTAAGPVPQVVRAAQEQHEEIVQAVREGRAEDYRRLHGVVSG